MNKNNTKKHFVTIFDSNYLPIGLTLYRSLERNLKSYHLWILCADRLAERQLSLIDLPNVTLIFLENIENKELLNVKKQRNRGEYCWTLKPFAIKKVFTENNGIDVLSYVDADLYFYNDPDILFKELRQSERHVMIIEHSFAPEYKNIEKRAGRFSAGFITFRRTKEAEKVRAWWEEKCLEWCFAKHEEGKQGDQAYLNEWPKLFNEEVHILKQVEKIPGPWNVRFFGDIKKSIIDPVFYHFHSLQIIDPNQILLYTGYNVGKYGGDLYQNYIAEMRQSLDILKLYKFPVPYIPQKKQNMEWLRGVKRKIKGNHKIVKIY
ncbi:hypothetical protein ES703_115158 [subsurface metagenome]